MRKSKISFIAIGMICLFMVGMYGCSNETYPVTKHAKAAKKNQQRRMAYDMTTPRY